MSTMTVLLMILSIEILTLGKWGIYATNENPGTIVPMPLT